MDTSFERKCYGLFYDALLKIAGFIKNRKRKRLLLAGLFFVLVLLCGCENKDGDSLINSAPRKQETKQSLSINSHRATNYVAIKYRDTSVDINAAYFEHLNTAGSSFVRGAWYDQDNQYMIINLSGTYYHYCCMPKKVWNDFKKADSYGAFYNKNIKEKYDCRQCKVPEYK